jgi:hypothetical protein
MKIISKDRIEELHSEPPKAPKKTRDVAVKLVTSEPKPLTKSEKKAEAEARKREMRLQHIEDERRRRENIKRKRREKKQWQKPKTKSMPKAESALSLAPISKTAPTGSKQPVSKQFGIKNPPVRQEAPPSRSNAVPLTVEKGVQQQHPQPKDNNAHFDRHAAFESERSYIGQRINQLLSLIRFNITFKLTIGYAFRLLFIFVLLLALIYAAFSYYLFYTGEQRLDENLSYVQAMMQEGTAYDAPLFQTYLTIRSKRSPHL